MAGSERVEFRILGCLEVICDGNPVFVAGQRDQRLLAGLLLEPGRVVQFARIADVLWEDGLPPTATKQIRNGVSRLRRVLAERGISGLIVTRASGYQIDVANEALDALVFEAKVAKADQAAAAGQLADAVQLLNSALDLWRGPVLAGMSGHAFGAAAVAWEERRSTVREQLNDHRLALGRHHEALGDIRALAAEYPLRGKPTAQLMLALYRCGRQAEALAVYDGLRTTFSDELGLDPPHNLQRLRQQILTDDPEISGFSPVAERRVWPQTSPFTTGASPAVPRQLPVTPAVFVGRERELAWLAHALDTGAHPKVAAVSGMAGVGKTALAIQWARQNEGLFRDGTLYVNLRGFDPSGRPVAPDVALDGMLRALGVPTEQIPYDTAERSALFRSVTANRALILVLDNARDPGQVRPLLPGSGSAVAIVTSRTRLAGLIVRDGVLALALDVLEPPAAIELLRAVAARSIPDAEARELAYLCDRLPLALRVAAERMARDPSASPSKTLNELSNPRARLDILEVQDDEATAVRRVLSWSYDAQPYEAQLVLRYLSYVGLGDIDIPAAAVLTDRDQAELRPELERLADGHLLIVSNGRYSMHDLVRCLGREWSAEHDDDVARNSSVARLAAWYLHSAVKARQVLSPQLPPLRAQMPEPTLPPVTFRSAHEALLWCETERVNLVSITRTASEHGLDAAAWQLPTALYGFFELRKYWSDWIETHEIALLAARRIGDREAEGRIWCNIGNAYRPLFQFDKATGCYREALELFLTVGYRQGEAKVLGNLGTTLHEMGNNAESIDHHRRALMLFDAIGDSYGSALTLTNLGEVYCAVGQLADAMDAHQQSFDLFVHEGDVDGQARALSNIGKANAAAGEHARALDYHRQATELYKTSGNRLDHAYSLAGMMAAHFAVGESQLADEHGRVAAQLLTELGHDAATGQVLNQLAVVNDLAGNLQQAAEFRQQAATALGRVDQAQREAARRLVPSLALHKAARRDNGRQQ